MCWSLDTGYLVNLFSVAYLQHWYFVFSTAKQPWLHAYAQQSADLAFRRSQGQNLPISQTRAVWELFIFEVKGESSLSSPVNSHTRELVSYYPKAIINLHYYGN